MLLNRFNVSFGLVNDTEVIGSVTIPSLINSVTTKKSFHEEPSCFTIQLRWPYNMYSFDNDNSAVIFFLNKLDQSISVIFQ